MSHFWKPGTKKPRMVDDEEGGVLFLSTVASSSSSSGFGYGSMENQRQRLPVYQDYKKLQESKKSSKLEKGWPFKVARSYKV